MQRYKWFLLGPVCFFIVLQLGITIVNKQSPPVQHPTITVNEVQNFSITDTMGKLSKVVMVKTKITPDSGSAYDLLVVFSVNDDEIISKITPGARVQIEFVRTKFGFFNFVEARFVAIAS